MERWSGDTDACSNEAAKIPADLLQDQCVIYICLLPMWLMQATADKIQLCKKTFATQVGHECNVCSTQRQTNEIWRLTQDARVARRTFRIGKQVSEAVEKGMHEYVEVTD